MHLSSKRITRFLIKRLKLDTRYDHARHSRLLGYARRQALSDCARLLTRSTQNINSLLYYLTCSNKQRYSVSLFDVTIPRTNRL